MKVEVDNHKLMFHPQRVSEWLQNGDCFPVYVEIGPTNRCNHRCIFCALDYREHTRNDIDPTVMIDTLKEMAKCGVKSVMFAGEGEPLLHKNISDFIETAKTSGMDVALSTNGVMFSEEILKKTLPYLSWVRYSLDAGTMETHRVVHGAGSNDFNKIIKNIRKAVKIRNENGYNVTLGVQMLIIPDNIREIIPFIKLIRDAGADNVQLKPYSHHPLSNNQFFVDHAEINNIEQEILSYNSDTFQVIYRKMTLQRLHDPKQYQECLGLPFYALIESDGSVIPCNLYYNNKSFTYGNLYKESFSEILKGSNRKKILGNLRKNGVTHCREGCRLDAVNRYLYSLKNPHPHVNFI
jgi:GTP 3',8-cyclase